MTLYVITKCDNGDATNIYYRDEYTARKVFESFIKKYMKDDKKEIKKRVTELLEMTGLSGMEK